MPLANVPLNGSVTLERRTFDQTPLLFMIAKSHSLFYNTNTL